LRHKYLEIKRATERARFENRPTGLAAFLGRVTGVERLRGLLHRHQDAQALKAFGARLEALKGTQGRDRRALEHRARLEEQDLARRESSLTRVERREKVALLRDLRAEKRIHMRGEDGTMPSLANIARIEKAAGHGLDPALVPVLRPGDTRETFEQAVTRSPTQVPDLLSAFARASQQRQRDRETGDDKAPALDRMTRPSRDGDQVAERPREPDRGGD
jgi:hypothetical protein